MKIIHEKFLDGNARSCPEDAASLKETGVETIAPQSPSTVHETSCTADVDSLIAEGPKRRDADCVPFAINTGEVIRVGSRDFICDLSGIWVWENAARRVEIETGTYTEDVEKVLGAIDDIEDSLLARGLAKGKPVFKIGFGRTADCGRCLLKTVPAQNQISFPPLACGRVAAVVAEEATSQTGKPVHLQGLLLSGVCHLLAALLAEEEMALTGSMTENFPSLEPALSEISRGFLSPEVAKSRRRLAIIRSHQDRGAVSIRTAGVDVPIKTSIDGLTRNSARELFFEMVRSYYIDPSLTGEFPPETQTDSEVFDSIRKRLLNEAEHSRETGFRSLFPRIKGPVTAEKILEI